MAELNDKLITYGNLSTFHDNLINDSVTSGNSTWSSSKIASELSNISVDMLQEVTYAQLKSLRDNSQLVPGQQYRITDYVTTTAQANTQSAGHQFDIIVVADSEDKLNENARAINSVNDGYFKQVTTVGYTIDDGIKYANDFYLYEDGTIIIDGVEYYRWHAVEYGSEKNIYLLTTEATYNNEPNSKKENMDVYFNAYHIVGCVNADGQETENIYYWNADKVIIKTEFNSTLNKNLLILGDTYWLGDESQSFGYNCNLSAWELKYCLDNDTDRFAWADTTNGKGVIYYMKDEWNNECPYDFKNIQFKRWIITAYADVPSLIYNNSDNPYKYLYGAKDLAGDNVLSNATYGSVSQWLYTFTLKNLAEASSVYSTTGWYDYTVVNSLGLKNDEELEVVCYGNKIKEAKDEYNSGKGYMPIVLNNIIFFNCYTDLSDTSHADDFSSCNSNTFGTGCYNNTFGNNCYNNTFGNAFISNTFGNYCYNNTFEKSCYSNTFGNECYNNTFGNECVLNRFGNAFISNTFGNNCNSNTFGSNCCHNTFGKVCGYNNFATNYDTSSSQLKYINVLSGYSASGAVPSGIVLDATYLQIVGKNSQGVFTVKNPLD